MDNPWIIVLVTVAAVVALRALVVLIVSGGDIGRVKLAVRTSWRLLRDPELAAKIEPLLAPSFEKAIKPSGAVLRLLTLLQREGRLIDFLLEDMQTYSNDQVGAAVRDIHRQCQHALKEHLILEAIMPQEEEQVVEVAANFDPSAIQLTGNVTGQPPFRGTLKHRGWRVKEIKLTAPGGGVDEFVLQPAVVEI
jgi:hypothetical protein